MNLYEISALQTLQKLQQALSRQIAAHQTNVCKYVMSVLVGSHFKNADELYIDKKFHLQTCITCVILYFIVRNKLLMVITIQQVPFHYLQNGILSFRRLLKLSGECKQYEKVKLVSCCQGCLGLFTILE